MKLPVPPRSLMVFLSKLKVFWREWNVQTMVLMSFVMQLILILIAPFRKRTSNLIVVVSIWLAYLLADWVAAQGIGLIARPCGSMTSAEAGSAELYAFWAQFLLLHLGGPDTITALALEDNELWLRTGLHLGVQVYGGLRILVKSIAQYGSNLWLPTILMFMAGILKYLERVASLFNGRLVKFGDKQRLQELDDSNSDKQRLQELDDSNSDKQRLQELDDSNSDKQRLQDLDDSNSDKQRLQELDDSNSDFDSMPILSRVVDLEQLTNVERVRTAYSLFHYFKGLYVDQEFSTLSRYKGILSFTKTKSSEAAFRHVEMQLNFAYEAFYTKMVITHMSRSWKVLRLLVASLLVGCLAIWLFFTNKQGFLHHNVQITYTLLLGAIIAELLAFVRIQLSDWTIAQAKRISGIKIQFYNRFLSTYQKRTWGRYWRKEDAPTWPYLRRLFFRRWSESISQLNMISMCMDKPRPHIVQKAIDFFELKAALDKRKYVSHKWFSNHLRSFIFEDIKRITNMTPDSFANIGYTKGGMAFRLFGGLVKVDSHKDEVEADASNTSKIFHATLRLFNINWRYDQILTHWHIITELCYVTHVESEGSDTDTEKQLEEDYLKVEDYREICKTLSDYLFSLLSYQPEMMAFTETSSLQLVYELKQKKLEWTKKELPPFNRTGRKSTNDLHREFCIYIRKAYTITVGSSVDDIMRELEKLEEELGQLAKWKLMAEVWAELLYYAALRCKPRLHAAKLKQGGELLSVIWMLLLQFGYGLDEASHSREKLRDTLRHPETALLYNPRRMADGHYEW